MNKTHLFSYVVQQEKEDIVSMLSNCFDNMNVDQINNVFYKYEKFYIDQTRVDPDNLLSAVKKFRENSFKGVYYAPFDVNYKNFSDVPEETRIWFDNLGDLMVDTSRLTEQGDHEKAVQCFRLLHECIEAMESGDEIIFAYEAGMWMFGRREEPLLKAYVKSASEVLVPDDFAVEMKPLMIRDSYVSFFNRVYKNVMNIANAAQLQSIQKLIKIEGIKLP